MNKKIYLDNAAIEKPLKEVTENLLDWYLDFYNPSAIYDNGYYKREQIENVRKEIAKFINADPEQIIFCPSASIANTMAIDGFCKASRYSSNVFCSEYEHSSVLLNKNVTKVKNMIKDHDVHYNSLYVHIFADSVVGNIYDIKNFSKKVHDSLSYVFCDATAAFGKIPIDVKDLDVDMMSFAFQKIGGIVGCACLYVKDVKIIEPLIYGHQEYGMFGGTYNYPAIMAAGEALKKIDFKKQEQIKDKRDYFLKRILENTDITLNGDINDRLPNNINICIHNVFINSNQIVNMLDHHGFMVSPGGSACNAGSLDPDPILKSIGLSDDDAKRSIRITINDEISYDDIDRFCKCLNLIMTLSRC